MVVLPVDPPEPPEEPRPLAAPQPAAARMERSTADREARVGMGGAVRNPRACCESARGQARDAAEP